ncbi:hypothetical protein PVL29_006180 [Vitis rotundifolia]|uniref:CRIB domain-containing protein n=1 Tax=Vitis rotundifolia TaxID=103349 RepID=A0AA39DYI5_VITRO|nr:hypothetical protein PVL29_006180 [Vitis rotundifolia]
MSTKVKGLLKGLRYISQIFENEKEPEMQIGLPTDVKHVAHIGWDGPSVSTPSWMNEFKSTPETLSAPSTSNGVAKEISVDEDINRTEGEKPPTSKEKQRRRRSSSSDGNFPLDSPARNPSDAPKHSRRHHSSGGSVISGNQDGSSRSSRRQHNLSGPESTSRDGPGIPKQSRRRKSKGSSGGGSSRSRSKGQASLTDVDPFSESGLPSGTKHGKKNSTELYPVSVLEVFEEENECDEVSKELRDL